jgi:peptidoglycan hydrolase CwlO-like protein
METRLKAVENEVIVIRTDVQQVKQTVGVLEERQVRMHDDFTKLTAALNSTADQIAKLNEWTHKRGAFVAGAMFVIGVIGSMITTAFVILKDFFW